MNRLSILFSAVLLAAGTSVAMAQGASDAQIAAIVVTANQVDIDVGKFAQTKAHAADVKAFARQMVTDHTGVNKQAAELANRLKLTPEDNPTAQSLQYDAQGKFLRRYLPELARLPDEEIHAPERASPIELEAAGITLGVDYPAPIVDLGEARRAALQRHAALRQERRR